MMEESYSRLNNNKHDNRRRLFWTVIISIVALITILVTTLSYVVEHKKPDIIEKSIAQKIWENMRLPELLVPLTYKVNLDVNMDTDLYQGIVDINFIVVNTTKIVIFHEVGLNITNVSIKEIKTSSETFVEKQFEYLKNEYYVLETRTDLLKDKKYTLTIKFVGIMHSDLCGFYSSYHVTANKTRHKVASTFFSPISARKAFPCLDEPKYKANFTLTLTHSDKYSALGNMPVESRTFNNNKVTTEFQSTLKMSTYILCWVIFDFVSLSQTTKSALVISTWAPKQNIDETRYILKTASLVLDSLEEYFQIPFPLKKLDIVGIPNFGPAAMENWGLTTLRFENLLLNENTTTEFRTQRVFHTIAHELVHQWFGNLATMKFWTDAWLKEGFANYISLYLGNEMKPQMEFMKYILNNLMLPALTFDSYSSSHPISTRASSPDEIRQIFDTITYQKGSCMVQMLHNYLGKENFRKGLQRYLTVYGYKNADQDDLWTELSNASGKNVKEVMDTWTLQLGFPVITVKRINDSLIHVSQKRYSLDTPDIVVPASPFNYAWNVPILYRNIQNHQIESYLLKTKEAYLSTKDDIILNPDHALYYRVNYDNLMLDKLTTTLQNNIDLLSVQDRTGLISDVFSMVAANLTHVKNGMELLKYLKKEYDFYPWQEGLNHLLNMLDLTDNIQTKNKLKKYILKLTTDILQTLGWQKLDTMNREFLQEVILKVACLMGEKNVIRTATSYYKEWMNGNPMDVEKNLVPVVRECAIRNGPDKYWDFANTKYLEGGSESLSLLVSLAVTTDKNSINKLLNLCLDSNKIESQDAPYLIGNIATRSSLGRELAWNFVKQHWSVILKQYGDELFLLDRLLSSVLSRFSSDKYLKDIENFFSTKTDIGSGTQAVKQSITEIKSRISWKKINEKELENWLISNNY